MVKPMHPLLTHPSSFLISSASILRFFLIPSRLCIDPMRIGNLCPVLVLNRLLQNLGGPDSRFLGCSPVEEGRPGPTPEGLVRPRLGKRFTIAFQQGCAAYWKIVSAYALLIRIL